MSGGAGGGKTFTDATDSVIEFLEICGETDIEYGIGALLGLGSAEEIAKFKAGIATAIEKHLGTVIVSYVEGPRPVAQASTEQALREAIRTALKIVGEPASGHKMMSSRREAFAVHGILTKALALPSADREAGK